MFEGDGGEGGVAVGGVVVKGALVGLGSGGVGDLDGAVGGEGVEYVNVVGPGDGVECSGEVMLLVPVRMRTEIIWRDGIAGSGWGIRLFLSGVIGRYCPSPSCFVQSLQSMWLRLGL